MTAVHVRSVPVVFAPTSHDVVHEVRLCHIHCGIDFNLPKKQQQKTHNYAKACGYSALI